MRHRRCLNTDPARDETAGTIVYTMGGKLVGKPECYDFLEEARDEIQKGYRHVILDLANIEKMNSTGVGIVAALFTSARKKEGAVYVVNPPEIIRHTLEVAQLWPFLVACDTVDDALSKAASN